MDVPEGYNCDRVGDWVALAPAPVPEFRASRPGIKTLSSTSLLSLLV